MSRHVGFGVCARRAAASPIGAPIFESETQRGGDVEEERRFASTGLRGTPLCYTRGLTYIARRFPSVALPYECDLGAHWTNVRASMQDVHVGNGFEERVREAARGAPIVPWVLAFRTESGEHHGNALLLLRREGRRPLLHRYEPRGARHTSYSHERLDALLRAWAHREFDADFAGPTDFQRSTGPQSLEVVEAASRRALPDVGTCALWSLFFVHCFATRFEDGGGAADAADAAAVSDWIDDRFADEFDVSMCIQAYGKLIEAEVPDVDACGI